MSSLGNIYEHHHHLSRRRGVSVMKNERGEFFRRYIGAGKKILDIGCRDGTLTSFFSSENEVLGVDIDKEALSHAAKDLGIKTVLMDINAEWEELKSTKFDAVVAGEVLEHLYFPNLVIKKVTCHLTSNGIFVGSIPNAFSIRHRLRYLLGIKMHTPLNDPTHINQFTYDELKRLLEDKFKIVEIRGFGRLRYLARVFPSLFAFDLVWVARYPKF